MKTQKSTIVALIAELLQTHIEKCDDENPNYDDSGNLTAGDIHNGDATPHVIDEKSGTKANITLLAANDDCVRLELDDGAIFIVQVK